MSGSSGVIAATVQLWRKLLKKTDDEEIVEKEDEILELAIHYVQNGS